MKPRRSRVRSLAVETIERPDAYTRAQIQRAVLIAHALHSTRFVLAEPAQARDR